MTDLRDGLEAAIKSRWLDLKDDYGRWIPLVLDEQVAAIKAAGWTPPGAPVGIIPVRPKGGGGAEPPAPAATPAPARRPAPRTGARKTGTAQRRTAPRGGAT